MFRKVLIGDTAGRIVDHIFAFPEHYVSAELLMALILFAIQIYADFSGYSSIARGLAKILGIELMKNFEQPYLSRNITEFWRRWHISLSSWLKDYLYISLGGNRKGKIRTYVNLMITMLLGGLWHGASWNFVIWGGLHGIYLAIHKMILGKRKIAGSYSYDNFPGFLKFTFNVLLTNIQVLITWLFFRAKTLHEAGYFINNIIHWTPGEFTSVFIRIGLTFAGITLLWDILEYYTGKHTFILRIRPAPLRYGVLTAMLFVVMLYMFQAKVMPFIYFQF